MTTNIILKKSSITGRIPSDSALAYGELALNYTDGKLFYKHSSQSIRNFLDENQIISLIDSDYVSARAPAGGGGGGTDSAQVIGIIEDTIDSDYINSRVTATAGTDSAQVISLITDTVDSAYIQARQVDIFRDSAFITTIIDSDYIAARSAPGTDSATVVGIITDTVDSAYVAARTPEVDFTGYATESYVTTQINNLVDGAPDALNTLNELAAALNDDSDAYNSLLSVIGSKLDSAGVTNLVDSAYVQARITVEAGTDSATVISLITDTVDSAYIANRVYIDSDLLLSTLGVGKSPLVTYQFTADSGQTTFTGLDDNSNTLTYTETENLLIFVNGVLLATTDYTSSSGTSIVFDIAADSGDTVTIARFNILDAIQSVSPIDKFVYTADSGQTVFSGVDDNSNTLNYSQENLLVYLNGILLVDSADYTATSGSSVVLTSASAVDDVLTVTTFNLARGSGLDSSAVTGLVDSAYIQARQTDIYRDSGFVTSIIDSDYINARVTATAGTDSAQVISLITDTVDSSYIQARQITYTVLDSADVINLIDSDYINARVTAAAGTDSAQVISLITDTVDSSYILSTMGVIGSPLALFTYEADSGQTVFSGSDLSGQSLYYNQEDILVYLNGILLVDSTDYTATNGSSVELNIGADSGNILTIASFNIRLSDGLDSADVVAFIDSDYIAARSAPGTDSATVTSIITDTVDTAFVVNLIGQAVDSTADVYFNSLTVGGNAVIQGDLQVTGTTTTVNAANLNITDNMIYLNAGESDGSPTAFIDIGFSGNYNDVGSYAHAGFFRDATDGVWKIFDGYTLEPDSSVQIDTTHASFSLASLAVKDITGQYLGFDSDFGIKTTDNLTEGSTNLYYSNSLVTSLVDSAYIAARSTAGTDSSTVVSLIIDTVDSAYISSRVTISGSSGGLDSSAVISLIDSSYILSTMGVIGSPLALFTYEADSGQTTFTGADVQGQTLSYSQEDLLVYLNGLLLQDSADYVATSGTSIVLNLPVDSGDILSIATFNIRLSDGLDSADVTNIIDSDYIAARSVAGSAGTDSAQVVSLITDTVDSAYIQARQVDIFRDSAFITTIIDSDYIAARSAPGTDSATVVSIVTDTVDSAYVAARTLAGTDSAQVISLITDTIDSDYIAARVDSDVILSALGTASSPIVTYTFEADSGQTVFSGSDISGRSFTYSPNEDLLVYINGILLLDSTDYTATNGTSLSLNVPADSDDTLTIARFNLLNTLNIVSPIDLYVYTADSGQTVFNGVDDNGNTFTYSNENLLVYLNGILLVDSADFNATSGTTVTLTSATAVDDVLSIATFNMSRGGVDSAAVIGLIDSDYIQTRQTGGAEWIEKTGTYTANANENIFVATAGAAITITLPASPTMGDQLRIVDATGNAGTHNIVVNGNSNKIMGLDSDLLIDVDGGAFGLVYYNATRGWIFTEK